MTHLELTGLTLGSPQTLGAVRVVPLLRERFCGPGASTEPGDLRIASVRYGDARDVMSVDVAGPRETGLEYVSFVPHGLIVSYTNDGAAVASLGASFGEPPGEPRKRRFARVMHRMVKRMDGEGQTSRLRILPLHLAMEGFLALHFDGPDILWAEYSQHVKRRGLTPRVESSVRGAWLSGFEEALRTFEIVPGQVGALVFVAEALASAFVVPHPDDYRRLHSSLLDDFYGELLREYALLYPQAPSAWAPLQIDRAQTLADLRVEVERVREAWRGYARLLTSGLLEREVQLELVRTMRRFRLERMLPTFDPDTECHIGERIVRDDGSLEYLKTFRLSAAQVRRAYLLQQLSDASWQLSVTAAHLRCSEAELAKRIQKSGLGYMLNPHVLDAAQRAGRG